MSTMFVACPLFYRGGAHRRTSASRLDRRLIAYQSAFFWNG